MAEQKPLALAEPQKDEPRTVVPITESAAILAVIERAARDPNVDVAKMEKLLALKNQHEAKASEQAFNAAMTQAQEAMTPVRADASNPSTKSKYASYMALDRALRPIYTKHGFALSFDTGDIPLPDHVRILCYVSHKDGHTRTYKIDMPADGKGAKGGDVMTKTHAMGSATSYATRYLLRMIFNITIGDDDGNSASGDDMLIDADQMQHILDSIARTNSNIEEFCKFMGVEAVKHITKSLYPKAMHALNAKERKTSK